MSGGADARTVAKIVIADDSCDSKLAEVLSDAARMGEIKAVCRELSPPRASRMDRGRGHYDAVGAALGFYGWAYPQVHASHSSRIGLLGQPRRSCTPIAVLYPTPRSSLLFCTSHIPADALHSLKLPHA